MKKTQYAGGYRKTLLLLAGIALSLFMTGCSPNSTVKKPTTPTAKATPSKPKAVKPTSVKPASKPVAKKTVRPPVKVHMKRHVQGREVKLTAQRQKTLSAAVQRAIPANTKINTIVSAIQRPNRKYPSVVVSHLLDGKSPDDTSSLARPEYNTIPKLTNYSKKRAYDILQAIMRKTDTTNLSELIVEVNHGVRETHYNYDTKTKKSTPYKKNVAITIYSTSISFDKIPKYKWQHMGLTPFSQNWKVEHNHMPYLRITPRI